MLGRGRTPRFIASVGIGKRLRAEESRQEMAKELWPLRGSRMKRFSFLPTTSGSNNGGAFPHRETDDQLRAITAIKLIWNRPLMIALRGDVGYGKLKLPFGCL